MAVTSLDGDQVGRVAETRGDFFRVARGPWRRDYWLRTQHVIESSDAGARLLLPRSLIGRYRLSAPQHTEHPHSVRQPLGSDGRS